MLTQIRHIQKGLLIVVTIIIVIAFAFLYSDFDFVRGTVGGQNCAVKVYDRCYRLKEAQKLHSHFDVALQMGMYEFAIVLSGEGREERDPADFIAGLVILRNEAGKMGIAPSAAEVKEAIPTLPVFQQPWVSADYVQNNILGPNGFTDGDLANLVRDYLAFQKLRDLIGAGVETVPSETEKRYIKSNQRYTASVVRFDRAALAGEVTVTDEEIARYYEENAANLNTEEKRGFDYVLFTPKTLPDDATNEQTAKANLEFANAVNRAYADLAEEGSNFVEVAKQYVGEKAEFTLELGMLEPFSPVDPPEMLKDDDATLETLFSSTQQIDEVTVPIPAGDGGYRVFHYSILEEPAPLTLEEATPAIREILTASKSDLAVNEAASAALAKLNEAVQSGKPFREAAEGLGLSVESVPNFSESDPPSDLEDAALIVQAVDGLVENEISAVTARPGALGYLLAHVEKIEMYQEEDAESRKNSLAAMIGNQVERTLFAAWFDQKREAHVAFTQTAPAQPVEAL